MRECVVIRSGATYGGRQGLTYFRGILAETAGSRGLCLQRLTIPPGERGRAHLHEAHESAILVLSGEAEMWWGERLEHHVVCRAGDYVYIPAGMPHLPANASPSEPCEAVVARTDPHEGESVVLRPDLDELVARQNCKRVDRLRAPVYGRNRKPALAPTRGPGTPGGDRPRDAPAPREEARGLFRGPPRRVVRVGRRISSYDASIGAPATHTGESRFLYAIISTVGSSLDLQEVLGAVVRLLTDACSVHACFVYLIEDDERLVLAAAPEPYSELVGRIALERGEGLAWWVAERKEPAWIRDSLLDDPRVKYVPELEEERFQSLVSVPIVSKDGNVIGVISSHTEAPREFTEAEVDVLVSSASLVAGAIENARLYEEMRRRVDELEHLTELGETLARAEALGDLLPAVAERGVRLLRAADCHLYLLDPASEQLELRASAPRGASARRQIGLSELGPELARSGRSASVAVPLVANDELLGLLAAAGTSEVDLARAVANQTAVALKKIELIDRLTEKNLIKDFFEGLAGGEALAGLEGRAARLGCDLDDRFVVLAATPPSDELERALAAAAPGSLFDRRDDSLRALLRVPSAGHERLLDDVRGIHGRLGSPAALGLSNVCRGAAAFAAGFEEARHALLGTTVLQGTPGVMTYEELGPYKYLLRMPFAGDVRDAHRDAVARIAEYDRARSTALLKTLEEFLRRRGNISATAEALYVHPNTLRQRLRRIGELSGLDLRKDDWLMVEIAVKMVRLHEALGPAGSDIRRPERL